MIDVAAWRREQRAQLYARRRALTAQQHQEASQAIARKLERLAGRGLIGLYWPIRHEPNLIGWARQQLGLRFCLPVVVTRGEPLEYWRWAPEESLARGVWDIPVPMQRDVVVPEVIVAPLVGFDRALYRLGNGGGYFDRTLAVMPVRPLVIGVGYAFSEFDTIYPQPHDIPMDVIVTEAS
jgi:5-formyltetrahydrofolate cyclo-ligase